MLECERVRRLQREEAAEEQDGRDPERRGAQGRRDQEQRGHSLRGPGGELTTGNRPRALDGMHPIVLRVTDVVDEVARARGRAVGGERGQGFAPARKVPELRREDDPREEKKVLRPLARAQRDERGPECRAAAGKVVDGCALGQRQRRRS